MVGGDLAVEVFCVDVRIVFVVFTNGIVLDVGELV